MNSMIKILSFNISHYNYSLLAGEVPLIKSLLLEVEPREKVSDFYGRDLCVTIKSEPEIFEPYRRYISLSADGKCDVSDINLEMRSYAVESVSGPQKCRVEISVRDKYEVFGNLSYDIDLQPYYCWSGFSCMPEYLCSLITPSQPEIEKIVSSAYAHLREQGELPITDGYEKKNVKKVYAVTQAIYNSIRNLKITYNITKTDYLSRCVSLQTCEMLLKRMIGSSLDIAMVFAACLENLGLNPILAIFRNHVLIGCFLGDLSFTNPVTENYDELMSMARGQRKVLFFMEPTALANGMSIDFENSCRMAREYCEKNAGLFTAVIDVKAARICGVRPLPNRIRENGKITFEKSEPAFDDFFGDWVDINDENMAALDRELIKVKGEMFDFSENNPLINADFKNILGLAHADIDSFVAKLLTPNTITAAPFSENAESALPEQCCAILEKSVGELNCRENEIASFCREQKLNKRLYSIYNIKNCDRYYRYYTYVSIYYAKWQSPDSSNIIYTPIFFYPCELVGTHNGYTLRITSEHGFLNPVFIEKIKKLFTVDFATLSKIPARELLTRRDYIFSVISSAFNGKNRIKFIPYITLGAYDFISFEDYATLSRHSLSSPLASSLFMGKKLEEGAAVTDIADADSIFPLNMPTPLEPDHRQKKAIYRAVESNVAFIGGGVNSGKTRVAANVIFNLLSKSKNVLYIGGTESACEDMEKYLDELKLKEYSLFLTPYAPDLSGKFDSDHGTEKRPSELYVKAQRLTQKKSEIAAYYKALHKKQKSGFDLYQIVMQYEKYKNAKYCVPFTPAFIKELDEDKVIASFRQISELTKASKECGLPYRHPLAKIGRKTFSYEIKSQAVSLINSYKAALESFLDCQDELCELMYIDLELLREDQTSSLEKLSTLLENQIEFLPASVFGTDCKRLLNRLYTVIENAQKRLPSSEQIFSLFEPHVLDLDAADMLNEYKNSLGTFFVKRGNIQKKLLNSLRNHLLEGKTLSPDALPDILYSLVHYAEYSAAIASDAADFKELFGIDMFTQKFDDERDALDKLQKIYSVCEEYILCIDNICRRECNPDEILPSQAVLIGDYIQNPEIFKRKFAEFKEVRRAFGEAENMLVKFLSIDIYSLKDKMAIKWYEYVYAWITELEQAIDGLKSWCEYLNVRENALSLGLESAVSLFENTQIDRDEFRRAFLKGFFKASCEYILSNERVFSVFSQTSCLTSCEDILELTRRLDEVIIDDLNVKLRSEYREYHNRSINDNEEKAYLDSKDLKELFASNRKLLQKRFPVTVSCGAAVASYIADDTTFDCIIVDDAHAVPYYSLIGLIGRAEKAVFLGMDTGKEKILFSAPAAYSLVGRGGAYCPESLYTRLLKCDIPYCNLLYKYDTRRDMCTLVSEIFSHHTEHSLPYPSSHSEKINIVPVNGVFERRGTLINFTEAAGVTDELKNLSPDISCAVCAFTRPQASLIREMWDKTEKTLPQLRIYAIEDFPARAFDRVIVSTVFSTSNNSEALPFNPAQLSGENYRLRLNYLLSSARGPLTVFTALGADSLNHVEPYTDSLYAFKRFIKFIYDKTGYFAPAGINEFDKNFIKIEICEFLQKLGYETVRNLGTSELKIDVAVREKDGDDFVLGILLDNYCGEESDIYTSEILIPELLEKDGWNTVRIFTNEWYENYNKQLEKISEKLDSLK